MSLNLELIKVWARDKRYNDWKKRWSTKELVKECKAFDNRKHKCTDANEIIRQKTTTWDEITTENPHEKKDYLNDEEEELLYENGYFDGRSYLDLMCNYLDRLVGFAIRLGNGDIMTVTNPLAYTDTHGGYYDIKSKSKSYFRAEIVSAILKAKKWTVK